MKLVGIDALIIAAYMAVVLFIALRSRRFCLLVLLEPLRDCIVYWSRALRHLLETPQYLYYPRVL